MADFRTDGGATWLNLLATSGRSFSARPIERLRDEDDLRDWLELMGFQTTPAPSGDDVALARSTREALRELAMAAVEARAPTPEATVALDATLTHRGRAQALPRTTTPREALAEIASQAVVTLRGPDARLLKECGERDCRWVFLDPSGRRRWCPAPSCASRGRVRAHREALAGA